MNYIMPLKGSSNLDCALQHSLSFEFHGQERYIWEAVCFAKAVSSGTKKIPLLCLFYFFRPFLYVNSVLLPRDLRCTKTSIIYFKENRRRLNVRKRFKIFIETPFECFQEEKNLLYEIRIKSAPHHYNLDQEWANTGLNDTDTMIYNSTKLIRNCKGINCRINLKLQEIARKLDKNNVTVISVFAEEFTFKRTEDQMKSQ